MENTYTFDKLLPLPESVTTGIESFSCGRWIGVIPRLGSYSCPSVVMDIVAISGFLQDGTGHTPPIDHWRFDYSFSAPHAFCRFLGWMWKSIGARNLVFSLFCHDVLPLSIMILQSIIYRIPRKTT